MFRDCAELQYGNWLPLWPNRAVYKGYVRPEILYGMDALLLKESEIEILRRTERPMVREMCVEYSLGIERANYLMQMSCLNEAIDVLVISNSVDQYGHVLRREGGNVFRRAFDCVVESDIKRRLNITWWT